MEDGKKRKVKRTCYSFAEKKTLYVSHSVWLVMSRINYSAKFFLALAAESRGFDVLSELVSAGT